MLDTRSLDVVEELLLWGSSQPTCTFVRIGKDALPLVRGPPRAPTAYGAGQSVRGQPLSSLPCSDFTFNIYFHLLGSCLVTFALLILTPLQSHPAKPSKPSTSAKGQEQNKKG